MKSITQLIKELKNEWTLKHAELERLMNKLKYTCYSDRFEYEVIQAKIKYLFGELDTIVYVLEKLGDDNE